MRPVFAILELGCQAGTLSLTSARPEIRSDLVARLTAELPHLAFEDEGLSLRFKFGNYGQASSIACVLFEKLYALVNLTITSSHQRSIDGVEVYTMSNIDAITRVEHQSVRLRGSSASF